jgi:hypothetical protein
MTHDDPDPLNSEGDELYSIYRKGLITRHLSENGRFVEALALESIDEFVPQDWQSANPYIEVIHSNPRGRIGPNVIIRIPKSNVRYTLEIDPTKPIIDGKYAVRPQLWVPLIAPLKYPGISEELQGKLYRGASPWLPQTILRRQYSMKDVFYAASGSGDNPGYYGGMALAAFSLEHLHEVSEHSIDYARKLVEGFLAMEMNGRNGYIIRYDRWFTKPYEVKEIRGASTEELLGIMLGIMFYLKAESPSHPLYAEARDLRDRILQRVSEGSIGSNYNHPFMIQSFWVKHFEIAFYASKGEERGSRSLFDNSQWGSFLPLSWPVDIREKFLENLAMYLTSIILVLEGNLVDEKKEHDWAGRFLYYIKRAKRDKRNEVDKNAYLGVVALLVNKFLNSQRDSHFKSDIFRAIWSYPDSPNGGAGLALAEWDEMISSMEQRIAFCKSLNNELVSFNEDGHWQHNLPLLTVWDEKTKEIFHEHEGLWRNLNPHRRTGMHFEWKSKHPNDWLRTPWRFSDYAIGMDVDIELNEKEYNDVDAKRYKSCGYLKKEMSDFRNHHNCQIEGSGASLLFLRMLLTHINPARYPKPRLTKDVPYPILPFQGVEPLSPKFLHCEGTFRSRDFGWEIGGDKDKALRVIGFPNLNLIVTATADREEKLLLSTWRITGDTISRLYWRRYDRFDQVILGKTSSIGDPNANDILVVAERAEIRRTAGQDLHYLKISMHRVPESGNPLQLLAETTASDEFTDSAKEIDMCILGCKYVGITFKTRHNEARVKVFELDFANNRIVERIAIDAGSDIYPQAEEIGDTVWIGSAWDGVLINGYKSKANPYSHFELFSRRWIGSGFGRTYHALAGTGESKPVGAVTVERGGKHYLVSASYSGSYDLTLVLNSWEILRNGELLHRGSFDLVSVDTNYLYKDAAELERLSMSRTAFDPDGGFIIAGKGFTDGRRHSGYPNKGLLVLYGRVTDDGKPTLVDWNCAGEGDGLVRKSVKMVDVAGEVRSAGQFGAVTAHKSKENDLVLIWWRYGKDFELRADLRAYPVGLATASSGAAQHHVSVESRSASLHASG